MESEVIAACPVFVDNPETPYADNSAVHQGNGDDAGGQSFTEIQGNTASLANNIDTASPVRSADNAGAHSSTIHQAQSEGFDAMESEVIAASPVFVDKKSEFTEWDSLLNDLLDAARSFLDEEVEGPKLFGCDDIEEYDKKLKICLDAVAKAVRTSLEQSTNSNPAKNLWYQVGRTFVEAENLRANISSSFIEAVKSMVNYEVEMKGRLRERPSVNPWDADVSGHFSPEIVLRISRAYARQQIALSKVRLKEIIDGEFRVVCISADFGSHPTAHLVTSELDQMSKMNPCMWAVCVAKTERLKAMEATWPYRRALKESFGKKFLEIGEKSDTEIANVIKRLKPHVVYHLGYHQDGDRPTILYHLPKTVVVQGLAHVGTTGASVVDFVLCNNFVLPEQNASHFSEKRLIMNAPFHGNSFRQFYSQNNERLSVLRSDKKIRSAHRAALGLNPDHQLLLNISQVNRLNTRFFAIIFAVLKANHQACLVLIEHNHASKLRLKAQFKNEGLEDRLFFVSHQQLWDGSLHAFLAVGDVYVDTPHFNGHTAVHDALWGLGVVVSVEGTTLAGRVAVDLLTAFGTPENICNNDDAAIVRINQLLQNPNIYEDARTKAEMCRNTSDMYDNELRARLVLTALKEAYNFKLGEQQTREDAVSEGNFILDDDIECIHQKLSALVIKVDEDRGQTCDQFSIVMQAEFRGVQVDVVISNKLDPTPANNVIFRETLARDGLSLEYGQHAWTRAIPFNERCVDAESYDQHLDVILMKVRQKSAYAILLERPTSTAAGFFHSLAKEWLDCRGTFQIGLLDRTIITLQAMLKLLEFVHAKQRSYGGDPLDLHISPLRDGYHKEAVAKVQISDGSTCAIMLGRATYMHDVGEKYHHLPHCRNAFTSADSTQNRRTEREKRTSSCISRVSPRLVAQEASISSADIKAQLAALPKQHTAEQSLLSCCGGYSSLHVAIRDDLRRAAQAITDVLFGESKQRTIVERSFAELEGASLYQRMTDTLILQDFTNATGEQIRQKHSAWSALRKKNPKLADLLDLLALMLGDTAQEAGLLLRNQLFQGIVVNPNTFPQGLESAPEDQRQRLRSCNKLMKSISAKVLHYYVKGKELSWSKGHKKQIAVWLCIELKHETNRYYRSVRAAERGFKGEFGAVYSAHVERDAGSLKFMDTRYCLKWPNTGETPCTDGKDRYIMETPQRVENSIMGMYLNSNKNQLNGVAGNINCTRAWDPDWSSLGANKSVQQLRSPVRMGLVLARDVDEYEELLYTYDWKKHEEESGQGSAILSKSKRQ